MSLKLIPLASGSKGNATLIMSENSALLVDAGISYARLHDELEALGLKPSMLDGVVITHEHVDHVKALPRLCADCRVFAYPDTAREIYYKQGALKNVADVENYEGGFFVGDIRVEPFRIPHDAIYPLAYSFRAGSARCSVATDIGVPTYGVMRNIRDSKVVLLESNHDVVMLKEGKYPPALKARILSNKGHLSNDSAAKIAKLLCENSSVAHIVLGHISENNNTEEKAFDTVKEAIESCGGRIALHTAHQSVRSEEFEII